MRKAPNAGWIACVVALGTMLVASAVSAQNKSRKVRAISSCVKYDRTQADDGLNLNLDNTCDIDVECTMSWTLRCDAGGKHPASDTLDITSGQMSTAFASADACGDDGWRISGVKWSCKGSEQ